MPKHLGILKKLIIEALDLSEVKAIDASGEVAHGQEVWNILPDKLYHMTSESKLKQIKQGGLGSTYEEHKGFNGTFWVVDPSSKTWDVDRRWQKPGKGVFLTTSWEAAQVLAIGDSNLCFEIDKQDLDPELCYFDGDCYDVRHPDVELEDYDPYNLAIFYAGVIPFERLTIV